MPTSPPTLPVTFAIEGRFRRESGTANGGYTCGRLSEWIEGEAEVTLHRPPPVERLMRTQRAADGSVRILEGEEEIASARPASWSIMVPEPPSFEEAVEASGRYTGFHRHAFPECFVCGPGRRPGDGLRIFPGPARERSLAAGFWVPGEDLAGEDGVVLDAFHWAALDCPGGWAVMIDGPEPVVLGRMAARIVEPVLAGESCVAAGWPIHFEGRKCACGTAVWGEDGRLAAYAKATWIAVPVPAA